MHELHIERTSARGLVGNIYMGRVIRVLPGMQSAFIDIGGERAAFLHVADIWGSHAQRRARRGHPDRAPAHRRSESRRAGRQGPDRDQGRPAVHPDQHRRTLPRLLPQESHIGISQRIEDEEERQHLREKLQQLLPPEEKGGFIIRTMAETASDRELDGDVEYLTQALARDRRAGARRRHR